MFAVWTFLGALAAAAQSEVMAPEREGTAELIIRRVDGDKLATAPVLGSFIDVEVTGPLARTTLTQLFENPRDQPVEAVYVFKLPDGAAVDSVHLTVGDRTLEGVVMAHDDAQATYEEARAEGKRAALVARSADDVFQTRLANLGPGETVEVALTYRQVIRFRDGAFRLRVPLVAAPVFDRRRGSGEPSPNQAPRFAAPERTNPVAFRMVLDAGWPLAALGSPTHEVAIDTLADGRTRVELAAGLVPANGDLVLEWAPELTTPPVGLWFEETADAVFALMQMVALPPDAVRVPRETVFVLDTSGSMKDALPLAVRALALAIRDLGPEDRLNVLRFSSEVSSVFPEAQPATGDHRERALRYLLELKADGGTNIAAALEAALSEAAVDRHRQVVFLTDGAVGDMNPLLALIRNRIGNTRLFTIGLGSAPNAHFMRRAAEAGRGTYTFVDDPSGLEATMESLSAKLGAPALTNLEVDWDDLHAEALPATVRDLYADESFVLVARLGRRPAAVLLDGDRSGRHWQTRLAGHTAHPARGIAKLWAERKAEELTDAVYAGADRDQIRQALRDLGVRHQIVTSHTSLVVVDSEHVVGGGDGVPRLDVPLSVLDKDVERKNSKGITISQIELEKIATARDPWAIITQSRGEETVTVTAESPLLDERRLSKGTTVSQVELQQTPARDLWASVGWASGVGAASVASTPLAAQGASVADTTIRLDGLDITNLAGPTLAPSVVPLRLAVAEHEVVVGGPAPTQTAPGLTVELLTRRGSNTPRGNALLVSDLAATGASGSQLRIDDRHEAAADIGGPVIRDVLWLWGTAGRSDTARRAVGGMRQDIRAESLLAKVNAQPTGSLSVSGMIGAFDSRIDGLDAGPLRTEDALQDADERMGLGRLEAVWVENSNFYLDLTVDRVAHVDARAARASARPQAPRTVDAFGREDGAASSLFGDRRRSGGALGGNWFTTTRTLNHEVTFSGRWQETTDETTVTAPGGGMVVRAGDPLGLAPTDSLVETWRNGRAAGRVRHAALRIGDQVSTGALTVLAALRYDPQELSGDAWQGPRWRRLQPRVSLTWALGAYRKTLVRASAARFGARLGTDLALALDPRVSVATIARRDGASGELVPITTRGFDPLDPTAPPAIVDPTWSGPVTDELTWAVEHEFGWNTMLSFEGAWRTTDDLRADRILIRDADGVVRPAVAADYQSISVLEGTLEDGTAFGVPVFDLRPGLVSIGRRLIGGSDRTYRHTRLAVGLERRLSNRWSARGHLTWSDARWRIGESFLDRRDPTADATVADRPGDLLDNEPLRTPGWSLLLSSMVTLPRDITLAGVIRGREGAPFAAMRTVARDRADLIAVQLQEPRGADHLPDQLTIDLRFAKRQEVGRLRIDWSVGVFNLLDDDAVTERLRDAGFTGFGRPLDTLPSRSVRLGSSVSWR